MARIKFTKEEIIQLKILCVLADKFDLASKCREMEQQMKPEKERITNSGHRDGWSITKIKKPAR